MINEIIEFSKECPVLAPIVGGIAGAFVGGIGASACYLFNNFSLFDVWEYHDANDKTLRNMILVGTGCGLALGAITPQGFVKNEEKYKPQTEAHFTPSKEIKTINDYLKENNYKITLPEEMNYKI